MEEAVIQKPAIPPNDRDHQFDIDSESRRVEPLFSGLNLKNLMLLTKSYQTTNTQGVHGLFSGLHLDEALKNLSTPKQPNQARNDVTVGQYLDDWVFDNYPDPKTAQGRNRTGYENYIRDYLKPQLGNIALADLTPHRTHRFVNWLKQDARSTRTHNPLSQTTQAHVCACLNKALNDAVRDELINRNPLLVKVSLPRHFNTPSPFSKKELDILLEAKDIPDHSLIVTLALTGSRPGELLGCFWKDYDFDSGMLAIQRSLENHSCTIKDTKTHQKRLVPLVEINRAVLMEHYQKSKFNQPDDFIWPNKSGGPLSVSLVDGHFANSLQKLGLRKIRLYDLRHGHITELLNDGVPDKQIQERVGHASATMTKDRYGHFMTGAQEKSIRKWARKRFSKTAASEDGASDRIRTYDPRFTKPLLYP
jgi:integrase